MPVCQVDKKATSLFRSLHAGSILNVSPSPVLCFARPESMSSQQDRIGRPQMFASLRVASIRNTAVSRSRVPVARKPQLEPLEAREVPATLVLPSTDLPTFTATFNMSIPGGGTVLVTSHPVAG